MRPISLGGGAAISSSTKNTINTKSFMESELVVIGGVILMIYGCHYFIEVQGYLVE